MGGDWGDRPWRLGIFGTQGTRPTIHLWSTASDGDWSFSTDDQHGCSQDHGGVKEQVGGSLPKDPDVVGRKSRGKEMEKVEKNQRCGPQEP